MTDTLAYESPRIVATLTKAQILVMQDMPEPGTEGFHCFAYDKGWGQTWHYVNAGCG